MSYGIDWEHDEELDFDINKKHTMARFDSLEDFEKSDIKLDVGEKHVDRILLVEKPFEEHEGLIPLGGSWIQGKYLMDVLEYLLDEKLTYKNDSSRVLKRNRQRDISFMVYKMGKEDYPVGIGVDGTDEICLIAPIVKTGEE